MLVFLRERLLLCLLQVLFQLFNLLLVLLDHFLAEVGPLGQLMLNLLVVVQVLAQSFDDLAHLVIFVHLVLCLLRLVLKFTGQGGILDHGQFRGAH